MRGRINHRGAQTKRNFPSFSEGLSLRGVPSHSFPQNTFPFLFGGTFIEGPRAQFLGACHYHDFPSFSEGLSLRAVSQGRTEFNGAVFPFLFGGTFIGTAGAYKHLQKRLNFPSFSEGLSLRGMDSFSGGESMRDFPSFSEGLSLRERL